MTKNQSEDLNFIQNIFFNIRKEWISFNNFVLTDGIFTIMLAIPLLYALLQMIFAPSVIFVSVGTISVHHDLLLQLLRGSKLITVVLVAYIIVFKFSKSHEEGVYGYWLALGVDRQKLFAFTVFSLISISSIGIYLSIILPVIFLSLSLNIVDSLGLLLLIIVSQAFFVSFTLVLDELIEWSELAIITILLPYFLISSFVELTTLPGSLFFSETTLLSNNWIMPMVLQFAAAIGLGYIAYSIHINKDMELGG